MSSRIELTLFPSHAIGALCALPWLILALFSVAVASELGFPFLVLLALAVPAIVGAVCQYRRTGLLIGREAVTGLRVESGQLYACLGSGQDRAVVIAGESRLGAHFAILKLRDSGTISRTYPVVLATIAPQCRNTTSDTFRHFRVWLRLGPSPGGKASGDQVQETQ